MPWWKKSANKKTLDGKLIEAGKTYLGISNYIRLEEFSCDHSHYEDGEEYLELRDGCNGNVFMLEISETVFKYSEHWPLIEKTGDCDDG